MTVFQDFSQVGKAAGTVLVEILEAGELMAANDGGKVENYSVLFHLIHLLCL